MAKGAPGDMAGPMMAGGPQVAAAPPVDVPPPPPPQMQPPPQQMPLQSVPPQGDAFEFLRNDPRYQNARRPGAPPLDPAAVNQVILHDFGSTRPGGRSPYHIAVRPDGSIVEAYGPRDRAPHAYRSNPQAYGVGYDGPVGSTPTPEAMDALRFVAGGLRSNNPNLEFLGHGEAYNRTRGTPQQASRDGRQLIEASWRNQLQENPAGSPALTAGLAPVPVGQQPPAGPQQAPAPMAGRSLVAAAGLTPQQAPPAPAPNMRVASTAAMAPQPRTVTPTEPSALTRMPRTMPGRTPTDQLWGNQSPTQRWDSLNRTFDMPAQSPDGMDHYSQTGLLPQGMQARPDPVLAPQNGPGQRSPTQAPMLEAAGKRGNDPWKPNWNAATRMMAAVRPPQAQGLLPQAGIPPAMPPPPRAPWQAAQGMKRFNTAFKTG